MVDVTFPIPVEMMLTADEKPGHSRITAMANISPDKFRRFLFTVIDELCVIGMSLSSLKSAKMDIPVDQISKSYDEHVKRGVLSDNITEVKMILSQSSNCGICTAENDQHQTIVLYSWKWIK